MDNFHAVDQRDFSNTGLILQGEGPNANTRSWPSRPIVPLPNERAGLRPAALTGFSAKAHQHPDLNRALANWLQPRPLRYNANDAPDPPLRPV